MTKMERDLMTWLAMDGRPVNHVAGMSCRDATAWIRSHGGNLQHVDALVKLREILRYNLAERIGDATNIVRLRA